MKIFKLKSEYVGPRPIVFNVALLGVHALLFVLIFWTFRNIGEKIHAEQNIGKDYYPQVVVAVTIIVWAFIYCMLGILQKSIHFGDKLTRAIVYNNLFGLRREVGQGLSLIFPLIETVKIPPYSMAKKLALGTKQKDNKPYEGRTSDGVVVFVSWNAFGEIIPGFLLNRDGFESDTTIRDILEVSIDAKLAKACSKLTSEMVFDIMEDEQKKRELFRDIFDGDDHSEQEKKVGTEVSNFEVYDIDLPPGVKDALATGKILDTLRKNLHFVVSPGSTLTDKDKIDAITRLLAILNMSEKASLAPLLVGRLF
jgi:hypothetical protein